MTLRTTNAMRVLCAIAPYLDSNKPFVGTEIADKLRMSPALLWARMGQLQQWGHIRKISIGHYAWDTRPDHLLAKQASAPEIKPTGVNAFPDLPLKRLMAGRA